MKYFIAYQIGGSEEFSMKIKAKNLGKAWKKVGKELENETVSLEKIKSDNDDEAGIMVSEVSKNFYKSFKED